MASVGFKHMWITVPEAVEKGIRRAAASEGLPVSTWISQLAEDAVSVQESHRAIAVYEVENGMFMPGNGP